MCIWWDSKLGNLDSPAETAEVDSPFSWPATSIRSFVRCQTVSQSEWEGLSG